MMPEVEIPIPGRTHEELGWMYGHYSLEDLLHQGLDAMSRALHAQRLMRNETGNNPRNIMLGALYENLCLLNLIHKKIKERP